MKKIKQIWDWSYSKSTIIAFVLLVVLSAILFSDQNFLSTTNFINIFLKAAKNGGLLALGMGFVIIVGEIDLSVGAVFALSGIVFAQVGQINPFLGIISGLLTGIITGFLIGFMVTKMKISSWIASIAMMFGLRGLSLLLSSQSIPIDEGIMRFGELKILTGVLPGLKNGVSILVPVFILLTFLCMHIAKNTKFGMRLYAVGGNEEAARMMGISVDRTKMIAFIISGLIASFAGILLASSSGSATLRAGDAYETFAIAMCAIGGIKLTGGQGKFSGVFFGILIYFLINTIFTYLPSSISTDWQNILMGALVLVSVILQTDALKFKKQKTK